MLAQAGDEGLVGFLEFFGSFGLRTEQPVSSTTIALTPWNP